MPRKKKDAKAVAPKKPRAQKIRRRKAGIPASSMPDVGEVGEVGEIGDHGENHDAMMKARTDQ